MLQIGIFSKLNRRFCVSNYLVTLVVSQSHSMSDVVSDHQRSFQDWFCRMEDVGHLLMNTMTVRDPVKSPDRARDMGLITLVRLS